MSPAGRVALLAGLLLAIPASGGENTVRYPPARRGNQVDQYHGTLVADPWRGLEALDSAETQAWVKAQNELTAHHMAGLPRRAQFASSLRRLFDYERLGVPDRENGRFAFLWNPGLAEQDVLRVSGDLARIGAMIVDPLAIRSDGTVSVSDFALSPDASLLAYALSDGGSDWKTWRVRDLVSGRDLPEILTGMKFTGVSWSRDRRGFYYSRYPVTNNEGTNPIVFDDKRQVSVYFHVPGTAQSADVPVFGIDDHPTRNPYATVSRNGRFLILHVEEGYLTNGVYFQRLSGDTNPTTVRLLDAWDARYDFLGSHGDTLYFLTTNKAPRGRIIAIDVAAPDSAHWHEVVPQSDDAIETAAITGDRLVIQSVHDAHATLRVSDLDGRQTVEVGLPGQGTVAGLRGNEAGPDAYFSYSDFTSPRRVYRLNTATGALHPVGTARTSVDAGRFIAEQVFYRSRDGSRIPLTMVRRKDVVPNGRTPTVLYGYGGFNVSLLPTYSAARMAWIEAGGIYAQANLRGGGEYGEAWHLAGTRLAKQNVFDDFIAAAEWLIERGVTSPENLAIWGGSNGGLLVGAVLNQRPELFAAAVPAVGVMDMLRYQTASLNARQWASDYGSSENAAEFRVLRGYSPYHNVRPSFCYPAVLVQADANDDRVVAWHSYKYAAALQASQQQARDCNKPVLIRIETRSGHGAGAALSKTVNEYADQWAFVAAQTGLR